MSQPEYTLRLLPVAEVELTEIIDYITADRPSAAEAFRLKVEKSLLLIAKNPYLGRAIDDGELMRMGYRVLAIEPYLIFYVVEGDSIVVHRILHGARDYLRLF